MAKIPVVAAGYVVQLAEKSNRFLSRGKRFVKHSTRSSSKLASSQLGIERAWVHKTESLLRCDGIIPHNAILYPARYNYEARYTGVGGNTTTFEEFLDIYRQPISFR